MGNEPFKTRDFTKCLRGLHDLQWRPGGGKRYCPVCEKERHLARRQRPGDRELRAQKMREWRAANTARDRENWGSRRRRNVETVRAMKVGNGCRECGEKHPACLEFHHRDPSQKELTLASKMGQLGMGKLLAEIAKCDVLCSNCHRKLHWDEGTAYRVKEIT